MYLGKDNNLKAVCEKEYEYYRLLSRSGMEAETFKDITYPAGEDLSEEYFKNMTLSAMAGMEKKTDYLRTITFEDYDWKYAKSYLRKVFVKSGCSSFRNGNFYGRNYDWYVDNDVDFIVYVPAVKGKRHANIGISSSLLDLETVEKAEYDKKWGMIPFYVVDGINDAGVCCNINVVPQNDLSFTTGTNPGKPDLCALAMIRFILDYADSAKHAVELLREKNIYCPQSTKMPVEIHFMVADADETIVVEFIGNKMKVITDFIDNKPIMTNFYLYGFDGSNRSLTPHASGVERYGILRDEYDSVDSVETAMKVMKDIKYTNAYSEDMDPLWYSEFVGKTDMFGDITKDTPREDYKPVMDYCRALYKKGERNKTYWQSVHTCVYDLANKSLSVCVQEDYGNIYTVSL